MLATAAYSSTPSPTISITHNLTPAFESSIGILNIPEVSSIGPEVPACVTSHLASKVAVITTATDTILSNGITIHRDSTSIREVVEEFPMLWEEGWMRIPLKSDWEKNVSKTARVYPLSTESKDVVDKTFDKLHE